jgi:hypothetical protein
MQICLYYIFLCLCVTNNYIYLNGIIITETFIIFAITIYLHCTMYRGTRWSRWLRHYATSRKVAGSSPHLVDFFIFPNFSSRTMGLGSTQPLTEIFLGGKGRPVRKADKLAAICEPTAWRKCGNLDFSKLYGASRRVTGIDLDYV